jgi:hypothetical protein
MGASETRAVQEDVMQLILILALFIAIFGIQTTESGEAIAVSVAVQPAEVECAVEPRSADEIDRIKATPAADEPASTPETTRPADEETLLEIQRVVQMADACAAAGDYDRLAALYSDHAIQSGVFDDEDVLIQPGTPEATPPSESPGKYGPPIIRVGYWIDETHVIAEVERSPTIREVRFVQENGSWLIDSEETVIGEMVEDAPGTPDASAVLPMPVMQSIIDLIANETGDEVQSITITSVEAVDWPDTFLGCPVEGSFAAQVITPGYLVTAEYEGEVFEVHTDLEGHAVTC